MHGEQHEFDNAVPAGASARCASQEPDAGHVQVQAFEHQQREEQRGLVASDQPAQTPMPGGDLPGGECEHTVTDVWVVALVVGVGVVPVVLVDPPAVTVLRVEVLSCNCSTSPGRTAPGVSGRGTMFVTDPISPARRDAALQVE